MTSNPMMEADDNAATADSKHDDGHDSDESTSHELHDVRLTEYSKTDTVLTPALIEGYLEKKSNSTFALGAWQRRWFVLDPNEKAICYYKHKLDIRDGTDEKGRILLTSIVIDKGGLKGVTQDKKDRCIFSFYVKDNDKSRSYDLKAMSLEDASAWVSQLRDALHNL